MAKKNETITKISVQGFKSIWDEQTIEIRPLTILAGANSSGKSSIMQPLLLLKQTIEATTDPGALLLDGPNVKFTKAQQLLSNISGKEIKKEFSVGIELNNSSKIILVFKEEKGIGFDVSAMSYSTEGKLTQISVGMRDEDIKKILPKNMINLNNLYSKIFGKEGKDIYWSIIRERCFLSFELKNTAGEPELSSALLGITPHAFFIPLLQGLIHLPGLRGNPQRTYPKSAGEHHFPGIFNGYVASVISQWQNSDNGRLSQLSLALENMGLTWKIKAERVDDTQVELRVGRLIHSKRGGAFDLVSIADVGFGVSQSLPVVVALLVAEPGQVIYLEQPEIHLHPRAQCRLVDVIKQAIKRGVIVIVETHSSLLLKEVQTMIATGNLKTNEVKLHWFQRKEDGATVISSADLDKKGAYGTWPEDFGDVELHAEKNYLDAIESKSI